MPDTSTNKVVTRFAPSPTGFLHIGGVRTALFAWLWARKNNGVFILRIEDTDRAREVEGSTQQIMDSLRWLGIDWDFGPDTPSDTFGPCLQSHRLEVYKRYAQKLVEKGLAYPDPYTPEEMATFREQAEGMKLPFLFRRHRPDTHATWDGTKPLRLKVAEIKRYHWHDEVRGDLEAGEDALDDFVIMKADGYPTYNFAHIVDDYEMGVTHVMRGEEFISSMPKFLSLYDALEIPWPKFVTLPPIMGPDGKKKLSKRDGAKDMLEYGAEGYLPVAMRNFLALIGWNPGHDKELVTDDELMNLFSLERIQKSGGAFNEEKLRWMNKEYLAKLSKPEQIAYVQQALPNRDAETLTKLTSTILERVHNQTDIKTSDQAGEYDWAFSEITYDPALLKWKSDDSEKDAHPRLKEAADLLNNANFSSPDTIKATLWDYAETVGRGELLWPLRVSLTGRERSPDPFICAFVLGKTETLKRIQHAISALD